MYELITHTVEPASIPPSMLTDTGIRAAYALAIASELLLHVHDYPRTLEITTTQRDTPLIRSGQANGQSHLYTAPAREPRLLFTRSDDVYRAEAALPTLEASIRLPNVARIVYHLTLPPPGFTGRGVRILEASREAVQGRRLTNPERQRLPTSVASSIARALNELRRGALFSNHHHSWLTQT